MFKVCVDCGFIRSSMLCLHWACELCVSRKCRQHMHDDNTQTANRKQGEEKLCRGTSKCNKDSKKKVENWPQTLIYPEGRYNIQFNKLFAREDVIILANFQPADYWIFGYLFT